MPKLKVEDECDIHPTIKAKNLPNPQEVYKEIKDILIIKCKIDSRDINERAYEHKKGDPEKVHMFLEAWKWKDKYTRIVYEIEMDMVLHRVDKGEIKFIGDVEIEIEGFVRTEYPQETTLQKSIVWDAFRAFYEKTLYGDLREEYMDDCRKYVHKIEMGIKAFLDLLPRMVGS